MAELDGKIKGWADGKWAAPDQWSFDGRPALIVNHMQVGIVGQGQISGASRSQEETAVKKLGIVAKQKKLIDAFRERKLPIVFCSVVGTPIVGLPRPKWGFIWQMLDSSAPVGNVNNPAVYELAKTIPELGRRPEEPELYSSGMGPFSDTHLDAYLRHHGVKDIVYTGWTAHSTIYGSVLEATGLWYSVVVPGDATGSPERDKMAGDAVLQQMLWMYSMVTTVDDVIKHLPPAKV
jgi:nicotinamidase-related amidase